MKKLLQLTILSSFLGVGLTSFEKEQWTQKASFGGDARHRCTGFAIGNKGYIGGGHINSGVEITHEDYWQYDPGSDSWTQIADFGGGKRYQSTAFSVGEFAYVGLGEDDNDTYFNDFYRYVPQLNIWQIIAPYPGHPRRGATAFVIGEFGYVGTGQSDFGYLDDFYKYDPDNNEWYPVADFLGQQRSSAVGFAYNGKGYVGTGHIIGNHTKDFYCFDPIANSWSQLSDVGPIYRQDATGFVLGDYAYIGTGNDVDATNDYKDFWRYDFESDIWEQFNDFSGEGRRYMVSFVIGEIAYAGTGTDGTNMKDFWAFDPLLSTSDFNEAKIQFFPNPSTDYMNIETDLASFEFLVYDLSGRIVFQNFNDSNHLTLHKNQFGRGQFYFQIKVDHKVLHHDTFIFL